MMNLSLLKLAAKLMAVQVILTGPTLMLKLLLLDQIATLMLDLAGTVIVALSGLVKPLLLGAI